MTKVASDSSVRIVRVGRLLKRPQTVRSAVATMTLAAAWAGMLVLFDVLAPVYGRCCGESNETLFQHDPTSLWIALVICLTALLVASGGLAWRLARDVSTQGNAEMASGCVLVVFSVFGLIYGLLTIGLLGFLLILVSRPITQGSG
jgi:hypothetical protein